jgi:hypothetical protein
VDPALRQAYNRAFSDELFARYKDSLTRQVGEPGFRLAETPCFVPARLRDRLDRHAREILRQLAEPERTARMRAAVPPEYDAPGIDPLPTCVQVDFAIVRGEDGELDGRVVELQGFPSLYAFTILQARAWAETVRAALGRVAARAPLVPFFGGLTEAAAIERLRRAVLGGEEPESVILLELTPDEQKTRCDFEATRLLLGVDAVCATELVREGTRLYRKKNGRTLPVRRIYNRIVFDELEARKRRPGWPGLPFAYTDALDVTWCPHPNWYWIWSKYSLPLLDHPAVPRAWKVSELTRPPGDLADYVLKPLFSFAGAGVKVDVTADDLASVPAAERSGWLLQKKIAYARDLVTPPGDRVAAEMRVMCLRVDGGGAIEPVLNLVRLSRGKMLGVDQNRDLTWVGSSVGLWSEE